MVGEAESDEITLDRNELEDARWVGREELACIMEATHPTLRAPRPGSIAGWLLAEWRRRQAAPAVESCRAR